MTTIKSGTLACAALQAGVLKELYKVPDGIAYTVEVGFCNRNATDVKIRVAIGSGDTPADHEYRESDWTVPGNAPFARTWGLGPGEKVWVQSSAAQVGAYVSGFGEAA